MPVDHCNAEPIAEEQPKQCNRHRRHRAKYSRCSIIARTSPNLIERSWAAPMLNTALCCPLCSIASNTIDPFVLPLHWNQAHGSWTTQLIEQRRLVDALELQKWLVVRRDGAELPVS